ncbi:MAG: hypothetical protein ACXU8N_04355 [Telluria sp.]
MSQIPQLFRKLIVAKMMELGIASMVISSLYVVASERYEVALGELEQQQVQWTTTGIRTALHYKILLARLQERPSDVATLEGINPVTLLQRPPPGYLGELAAPDPRKLAGGSWYFDTNDKSLIYLSNKGKIFTGGMSKMLKFKVKSSREPSRNAGDRDGRQDFSDAQLVQLDTM